MTTPRKIRRMTFRMPEALATQIDNEATDAMLPINGYIVSLLRSHPSRKPSKRRKDGDGDKVKGEAG